MLKDFKAFILRGNVVDLAVGVVIGAAFAALVTALVEGIFTPILAIPGKTNFGKLKFTICGGEFMYGNVINALISFVVLAAAVFFFVVKPVNALIQRRKIGRKLFGKHRKYLALGINGDRVLCSMFIDRRVFCNRGIDIGDADQHPYIAIRQSLGILDLIQIPRGRIIDRRP